MTWGALEVWMLGALGIGEAIGRRGRAIGIQ